MGKIWAGCLKNPEANQPSYRRMTMRRALVFFATAAAASLVAPGIFAGGGERNFKATLDGWQEVPTNSTTGSGTFRAKVNDHELSIDFELSISDLEGQVGGAHIHIGRPGTYAGFIALLCGPGLNAPQPCPQSGTITGTITAQHVVGQPDRGIEPGNIAEVIAAMRAGATFVNVHSTRFPNGEIRGAIK